MFWHTNIDHFRIHGIEIWQEVSGFFPWISMQKLNQRPRNQGNFPIENRIRNSWRFAFKVLVRRSPLGEMGFIFSKPSIFKGPEVPEVCWAIFLLVYIFFHIRGIFLFESGVENMKITWDLWIDGLFNLLEYDESTCPLLQCFEGWEPQFKDTDIVEWSVLYQMLFGQNKL